MHPDHGAPPVTFTLQDALHAWPTLGATWGTLHAGLAHPTLFLSEAWVECWLAVYGPDTRPLLWTARAGGEVVAMALLVHVWERRGPVPVRCLYLNTAGEGADSVTLEHNTLLVRSGLEDAAWRAFADMLGRLSWDELVLVGADTDTAERARGFGSGWLVQMEGRSAPYTPLGEVRSHAQGALGLMSANTRSQLRRAARVGGAVAPLSVWEATTPAERLVVWHELAHLHAARWRARGQPGVFARPRWRAFHERLLAAAPHATRLLQLRAGGHTVAALYLLQHRGHVAFYQSGVRQADADNREKPGMLLHALAMDRLAAEGLEEYDFLASNEPEVRYKRSLARQERMLWWVSVIRPTWRSRLVRGLLALRQALRGTLASVGS